MPHRVRPLGTFHVSANAAEISGLGILNLVVRLEEEDKAWRSPCGAIRGRASSK